MPTLTVYNSQAEERYVAHPYAQWCEILTELNETCFVRQEDNGDMVIEVLDYRPLWKGSWGWSVSSQELLECRCFAIEKGLRIEEYFISYSLTGEVDTDNGYVTDPHYEHHSFLPDP